MQRNRAIAAGLLAGTAAIGLAAYSQRPSAPIEEAATATPDPAPAPVLAAAPDPVPAPPVADPRLAEEIESLLARLADTTAERDTLARDLGEREIRIAALTVSLAERDAALGRLQGEVSELRAGSDLAQLVAERDASIEALTADLAETTLVQETLRGEVATMAGVLAERDAAIDRLLNEIEDLRVGATTAPVLAAADGSGDKPVLAFDDEIADIARIGRALDAIKLVPEVTIPLASALRIPATEGPVAEVHFETGSARLSPGGLARAAAAAVTLADMRLHRVRLVGFADRTGSPARNRILAERRAEAVAAFLVANGLSPALIETAGLTDAAELPVATDPGVSEPLNRSVAIIAVLLPTG